MLWVLIGIVCVLALLAITADTLYKIVFARDITGIARRIIYTGQANSEGIPPEAQAGRDFWNEAETEPVSIRSRDGLTLRGRYYHRQDSVRTIVCVHGYRATGLSNFAPVLPVFAGLGCDILLIDHRACGKSDGKAITFGLMERWDVVDWCRWLTEDRGVKHPIFLDGVSMGCSCILMAANLGLPPEVRGMIADCGYTSPDAILQSVCQSMLHLPAFPLLFLLRLTARLRLGLRLDEASTLDSVRESDIPILFAHGLRDLFVPAAMGQANYDACRSKKWLLLSPEAAHGESWLKSREEYGHLIEELFESTSDQTGGQL